VAGCDTLVTLDVHVGYEVRAGRSGSVHVGYEVHERVSLR
jgi:hypothetical protein